MRTAHISHHKSLLLALAAGLALQACGSTTRSIVELDAIEFRARQADERVEVDTLDPDVLFKEAARLFTDKKFAESVAKYEVFLEHFPEDRAAPLAAFNAGLGREELQQWAPALALHQRALAGFTKESDRVDALFRIGNCQEKLEQWAAMEDTFEAALALKLSVMDRAEAWVRRGWAYQKLGDLTQAERAYKECLRVYNDNLHLRVFEGSYWVSMAQFQLGEIYRALFDGIAFRLPVERMERDLEDKSNLFLKAQAAYLRTVRLHNSQWSIAAGFRLGAMYEDFYTDMVEAEYPAELGEQEVALYFSELKKNILPLVQRAVEIYERNLTMSERAGARGTEWAEKTQKHLAHLRGLLRDEERRIEEERRMDEEDARAPSAKLR